MVNSVHEETLLPSDDQSCVHGPVGLSAILTMNVLTSVPQIGDK